MPHQTEFEKSSKSPLQKYLTLSADCPKNTALLNHRPPLICETTTSAYNFAVYFMHFNKNICAENPRKPKNILRISED